MSNELRDFIKFLQYRNGYTIEQVAKRIGYDRAYLNVQMNKKQGHENLVSIMKLLRKEFAEDATVYGGSLEISLAKETPKHIATDASAERLIQALGENNDFLRIEIKKNLAAQETRLTELEANLKKYVLSLAMKSHSGIDTILAALEQIRGLPKKSLARNADSRLVASAGHLRRKGKGPAKGSDGKA